ncbi:FapA family protein [Halobacillus rhizosphaerae]
MSRNKMEAYIEMDSRLEDSEISIEEIHRFLEEQGLVYGVDGEVVEQMTTRPDSVNFPLQIAFGKEPQNGKPGKIIFDRSFTMEIEARDKVSFRDIISIPSVTKGERVARVIPPTKGVPGRNVYGEELPAKPGKPQRMRAGKMLPSKLLTAVFILNLQGS